VRDEGRSEGRSEGALSLARARLRRTLELRGIAIHATYEETIAACSDLAILDRWLDRALTESTIDAVLRSD
jgi:hypothetical protein